MVVKCKQYFLWYVTLLTIIIFDLSQLTFSVKGHIQKLQSKDNGTFKIFHKVGYKRSLPDSLPKRKQEELVIAQTQSPVIAQTQSTATLECSVRYSKEQNISMKWSKKDTNGEYFKITTMERIIVKNTYKDTTWVWDDKRFLANPDFHNGTLTWRMNIRYTKLSDEGVYQCQICMKECSTSTIDLIYREAYAKILGGDNRTIPSYKECPLRLSCVLINSTKAPDYIFWYRDDRVINYDLLDGATIREGPQGSELIFQKANKTHSGNYSCVPSNAKPDSVFVHFGEYPFGLLGDENSGEKVRCEYYLISMLVVISCYHLIRKISYLFNVTEI